MADLVPGDAPFEITDELVIALIQEQFPDLAHHEIGRHYRLEEQTTVRIGDEYGATFPSAEHWDQSYARLGTSLAQLAPFLDFPSSAPVRTGVPGHGYPFHWIIITWISASNAAFVPLRGEAAADLGRALRSIHQRPAEGAHLSATTDVTLEQVTPEWEELLSEAAAQAPPGDGSLSAELARALWETGLKAETRVRRTWTHGNLEPRSIMSNQGNFAGIATWHALGVGNPAVDVGTACVALPTDARATMLKAYGKVNSTDLAVIQNYELLAALRYIKGGDPFLARLAWERLIELGVVHE